MVRHWLMSLAWLGLVGAVSFGAAAQEGRTDVGVTLEEAVFRGDEQSETPSGLVLYTVHHNGHWDRAWSVAANFITGWFDGPVTDGKLTDEVVEFTYSVKVPSDPWVKGGRGNYTVSLKRMPDGRLEGTWRGTFRGVPAQGRAHGTAVTRQLDVPDFQPVARGEHPRLLFRKSDLPALRKKAETAFGKAALAGMNDAIGLGVKYQLTGEKQYADQAWAAIEPELGNMAGGDKIERGRALGERTEQIAQAYDLCYDAWTPAQRKQCESHIAAATELAYQWTSVKVHGQISNTIAGPHLGPLFYGMALGSLAIYNEQGPGPVRPQLPTTDKAIPAAHDYTPPQGVPVVKLQPGQSPREWLILGPVNALSETDPLADAGGIDDARPTIGTIGRMAGKEVKFASLDARHVPKKGGVNLRRIMSGGGSWSAWFYTVLDNDKPQTVKVHNPFGRSGVPVMILNGRRVLHNQTVELERGKYPMLIGLALSLPWESISSRLDPASPADIAASDKMMASKREEIEAALKQYRFDKEVWERTDHAADLYRKAFELNRFAMYLFARERIGTGGTQFGAPSVRPMCGPNRYYSAHRRVFGLDVSPFADVTHYIPRKMMAHIYKADGKPIAQEINGFPGFLRYEYIGSKTDESRNFFAALWPILPEKWKPAMLWAWHYYAGIDGEGQEAKVLNGANAAYAFVSYPLDLEPQHPAEVMPLNWAAPDYGYYAFRSAWKGHDEFITQVFAKNRTASGDGTGNAAAYRLMGLGKEWITGGGKRMFECVVQLPQDEINEDGRGRVTYSDLQKDGSGVVTIDLADVYASARLDDKGRRESLYEKYGDVRRDQVFVDSGIAGFRAIGVDYSGKSGAPCLLVVIDRVRGAKEAVWSLPFASGRWGVGKFQMENVDEIAKKLGYAGMTKKYYDEMMTQVDGWKKGAGLKRGRKSPWQEFADMRNEVLQSLALDGNAFTITKGDVSLRGTFVSPGNVKLSTDDLETMKMGAKRTILYAACAGLFARGGGDYFCVMTVQKGDAPTVTVEGEGLDAVVKVGGQTVRFDGRKIVFGQ